MAENVNARPALKEAAHAWVHRIRDVGGLLLMCKHMDIAGAFTKYIDSLKPQIRRGLMRLGNSDAVNTMGMGESPNSIPEDMRPYLSRVQTALWQKHKASVAAHLLSPLDASFPAA